MIKAECNYPHGTISIKGDSTKIIPELKNINKETLCIRR